MTTPASTLQLPSPTWRVLLAEDNPINRHRAVQLLEQWRCQVDTAQTQDDLLACFKQATYDLFLVNWQMRALNPLALLEAMRETLPEQASVRVIGLIPPDDAEARTACLEAGMDLILEKPLNEATLASLFQEVTSEDTASATTQDLQASIRTHLRQLDGDTPDFMLSVLLSFMQNTPGLLREMHASLSNEDLDRISRAAHTLKASAQTIGLKRLSALARATEMAAQAQQPISELIHFVGQVALQYKMVRPALLAVRELLEMQVKTPAA